MSIIPSTRLARRRDMTTTAQHDTRAATSSRLAALRGNCMGAAVLLIVQFGLGISVNLYVTLPKHKPFLSTVFGSATLAAHVIVGVVLLGAAIGALVRAIRSRRAIVLTSVGFAAVVAPRVAGAPFARHQHHRASPRRAPAAPRALVR